MCMAWQSLCALNPFPPFCPIIGLHRNDRPKHSSCSTGCTQMMMMIALIRGPPFGGGGPTTVSSWTHQQQQQHALWLPLLIRCNEMINYWPIWLQRLLWLQGLCTVHTSTTLVHYFVVLCPIYSEIDALVLSVCLQVSLCRHTASTPF